MLFLLILQPEVLDPSILDPSLFESTLPGLGDPGIFDPEVLDPQVNRPLYYITEYPIETWMLNSVGYLLTSTNSLYTLMAFFSFVTLLNRFWFERN